MFGECWIWEGLKDKNGYGRLKKNCKDLRAHRVSYEANYGPIPKGMLVCHHCDNPGCVRPNHLFLGSPLENVRDMISKGRKVVARGKKVAHPGESNPAAKLTRILVKQIRKRYKQNKITQIALAKEYGVCDSTIGAIVRNEIWK